MNSNISRRALEPFHVLTGLGCFLFVATIFGFFSMQIDSLHGFFSLPISDSFVHPQNLLLDGQIVASFFWIAGALLSGTLWVQAFFRTFEFFETTTIALVLFLLLFILGLILLGAANATQTNGDIISPLAQLSLVLFAFGFVGFLFLLTREIIQAATSNHS